MRKACLLSIFPLFWHVTRHASSYVSSSLKGAVLHNIEQVVSQKWKVLPQLFEMPPILASLRISRRRTCQEAFFDVLQVIHFLVAMCFLWAGIVEFVKNPPYFDAYGDASVRSDLPQGLFQVLHL